MSCIHVISRLRPKQLAVLYVLYRNGTWRNRCLIRTICRKMEITRQMLRCMSSYEGCVVNSCCFISHWFCNTSNLSPSWYPARAVQPLKSSAKPINSQRHTHTHTHTNTHRFRLITPIHYLSCLFTAMLMRTFSNVTLKKNCSFNNIKASSPRLSFCSCSFRIC